MALPAFRAAVIGIPLTDQIPTLDHGKSVLQPVWLVALPGLSLAAIGLFGALWSSFQYQVPEPPAE